MASPSHPAYISHASTKSQTSVISCAFTPPPDIWNPPTTLAKNKEPAASASNKRLAGSPEWAQPGQRLGQHSLETAPLQFCTLKPTPTFKSTHQPQAAPLSCTRLESCPPPSPKRPQRPSEVGPWAQLAFPRPRPAATGLFVPCCATATERREHGRDPKRGPPST